MRAQTKVVLGQLVTISAGRDRGRSFVVVGIESPGVIHLADGRSRPTDKPKRKNVRHVKIHEFLSQGLAEKLQKGHKVTNEELRQAVMYFMKPDNN